MEWKCKASFEKRSFLLSLRGPELVLLLTLEVVTIFVVVEMEWKCRASFEKRPFLLSLRGPELVPRRLPSKISQKFEKLIGFQSRFLLS